MDRQGRGDGRVDDADRGVVSAEGAVPAAGDTSDPALSERDAAFYAAWAELLEWMREYAADRGVPFTKEADFTDYIYRMERPYDLPTTVMVASLSHATTGRPVLMASASQRRAVFKEVVLHPYESHVYRKLKLASGGAGLAEGRRVFTRQMLFDLADRLYSVA